MSTVQLSRVLLALPIDPSGQITALPIAEEGTRAKLLMEQLVRRSQAALAIQAYFEAKQIPYGIRVGRLAVTLAQETRALTGRKLLEKQAYDIELSQSEDRREPGARASWPTSRRTRGSPSASSPWSCTRAACSYPRTVVRCRSSWTESIAFDLDDPDLVDTGDCARLSLLAGGRPFNWPSGSGWRCASSSSACAWPTSGAAATGLRLFGTGGLPAELSFKNTTAGNHGVALGAIFGATYVRRWWTSISGPESARPGWM